MKIAKIQFAPWDKVYNFHSNGLELERGDYVIVKTELGTEMGTVVSLDEASDNEFVLEEDSEGSGGGENQADGAENQEKNASEKKGNNAGSGRRRVVKPILRKATRNDMAKMPSEEEKQRALKYCIQAKEKFELPMKFIDAHYSFDGSKITFAFIADGRVDFREMVKDLTRHFGRTIRLQQIGIRDEAKAMGDFGHCGKPLCCKFLPELTSITSDMAECQQCSHRGSDRISGVCGRLMCCLAYEQSAYEELIDQLPAVGSEIRVDGKKGKVIGQHVLRQTVDVEFRAENGEDSRTVAEIDPRQKQGKNKK